MKLRNFVIELIKDCPPRQSGKKQFEVIHRQRFFGATKYPKSLFGSKEIPTVGLTMAARKNPIHLDFTICRAMFGNGFLIGTKRATIDTAPLQIQWARKLENLRFKEVVRGRIL